MRIKVRGNLGNARISIQVDVGFGDVITPEPLWVEYPTILDNDKPRIQAYTLESAIAEKYQAMVSLDLVNSRMKDFYDIYFLSKKHSFDGPKIKKAIQETFDRRETELPTEVPIALTEAFFESDTKVKQWDAFIRKISDDRISKDPLKIVNRLKEFLWPVTEALKKGKGFKLAWREKEGWT